MPSMKWKILTQKQAPICLPLDSNGNNMTNEVTQSTKKAENLGTVHNKESIDEHIIGMINPFHDTINVPIRTAK